MVMDSTYYLPSEELAYRNYPEVQIAQNDINTVTDYVMTVGSALDDYNQGVTDKIDINGDELQSNITLCRSICDTLGNAPRICFDVLLEVRNMQDFLQQLLYIKSTYGNEYIGTPSVVTDESGGVV